ncbi:MAG: CamS family sex pheromone protein [Coprobacillus sp.]
MKKIGILCLVMFLLVGCSQAQENIKEQTGSDTASMDSFESGYYRIVDFGGSKLRENFYLNFSATSDFQTIGRGLQILSSNYFSTSSHYMSEGQYFDLDQRSALLKRDADVNKYPYSLQSPKGETIDGITDPIMVSNIQEQNYYIKDGSNYVLKGISLAVILDPRKSNNDSLDTPMSDKTIEDFGEQCIEKLYKYIRNDDAFKEVKDLPILITVFKATDTTNSTFDGNYILESYCDKEVGKIRTVDHENVLFTSARANEIDKTTASEFDIIKTSLKEASQEAVGFMGEAKYENGEIKSMVITANLNIKTYTELLYLSSIIADNINSKFTNDFSIKVLVNSQDKLQAVIIKEKGKSAKTYPLY